MNFLHVMLMTMIANNTNRAAISKRPKEYYFSNALIQKILNNWRVSMSCSSCQEDIAKLEVHRNTMPALETVINLNNIWVIRACLLGT